ncbi:uncharacterized protein LOC5519197 [Nematostella vectensis]|uniref:uncharacterized protein LOC5519197 n=1 Tax=Nematostella vectensis TaxID=45351 RepID=UPI0020771AD9|nr:uncharacterized protein LOC5519197 [Nematostella vectensis]
MGSASSKRKKKVVITSTAARGLHKDATYGQSFHQQEDDTRTRQSAQNMQSEGGSGQSLLISSKPIEPERAGIERHPPVKQHSQLQSAAITNQPQASSPSEDCVVNEDQEQTKGSIDVEEAPEIQENVHQVETSLPQEVHEESSDEDKEIKQEDHDKPDPLSFEEKVEKGLNGEFDFQIPGKAKIVRIFTSSTFTDTSVERNTLMERIYPRIKQFCQQHGYEFQVVDMRWGVRDESTDDHLTSELCMRELRACQELSTGPNFITFLGQKYGYRPFPPKIPATEFENLLSAVSNVEDQQLLRHWFRRDDNIVPAEYLLQPITVLLPDYRNYSNNELRKKASAEWWAAFERMQVVFREAADKALEKRERKKYYMSVTEDEIRRGIVNASNPGMHCFWFRRVITDLLDNITGQSASKFIDKTWGPDGKIDMEAYRLLSHFREKILPKALPSSNVKQFDVKWAENGIDPSESEEHAQYIEELCTSFYETLTGMIGKAVSERAEVEVKDPLAEEVFSHLTFCLKKCEAFHGREEFLDSVKQALLSNGQRITVLYGESGCGKTSIMAKICALVKEWLRKEAVAVVPRFVGISPDSSGIRTLLRSVCQQLCRVSGENADNVPEDMKSLREYFPECLKSAATCKTIVLLLDSLDQLSPDDGGRQLDWLPKSLPDNIYLVMSTLPGDEYECLPNLEAILPDACLKEVPSLPLAEADSILTNLLQASRKCLTDSQKQAVLEAFQQCQLPLYLMLAFGEACRWKSYTPEDQITLPPSVKGIINALFDRVERVHGRILVSHALGYITASKNGLTEPELEDLLSLDDDVLNDVYQYWTPPIRRLPPLLWIRIRADISDFLIDRGADETRVIYWYHRQFIEIATERYLGEQQSIKLHANMAEYFLGTWSDGKKKTFTSKKGETMSMDRFVSSQPLMFDEKSEKPIYNLRKLSELPYHLVLSAQLEKLKANALCNFKFLVTKLRARSLDAVLEDFSMALDSFSDDTELDEIDKTLRLSAVALSTDPRQLASQLLARLLPHLNNTKEFPYLSKLLESAYDSPVPCLIPSRKCLTAPGGTLVSSLAIDESGIHCCAFSCDGKTSYVGSTTSDGLLLQIINIQTGKLIRKMKLTDPWEMVFTWSMEGSRKDKDTLLIMGSKYIFMMNTKTGKITRRFEALEEESRYSPMPPVTFADDETRLVAITDKNMKIWTVNDGNLQYTLTIGDINVDEEYGSVDAVNELVVYSTNTNVFTVLDVRTGRQVRKVEVYAQGEETTVKSVKIGAGEKVVVMPSSLKSLRLYSLRTGALLNEIGDFSMNPGLHRLQLTPDRDKILNIIQFEVMITDLESGHVRRTLKSKSFGTLVIHTNLYTRDGRFACSIGNDNILRIYDLKKALAEDEQTGPTDPMMMNAAVASIDRIYGLFPSVDGKHAIGSGTVQNSSELSMWNVETGAKVRSLKLVAEMPPQEIRMCSETRGVGFMHDANQFHYKVYNFKNAKIERCLLGKASKRTTAFGAIDESHVIGLSRGRRNLKVWDVNSGRLVKQYKFGQKYPFEEMLISKNRRRVVCSQISLQVEHEDKTLTLIALDTASGNHSILEIPGDQLSLAFSSISHDGRYLVCSTKDFKPRLWDLEAVRMLHHLEQEEYPISYASGISLPLRLALTAQSDGDINAWDIDTGVIKHTFKCETVDVIMVSSDGFVAYSRYRYRISNLDAWDLRNGTKLATFTSDWKPEKVDIVGDTIVLNQADSPSILTLQLHIPGSRRVAKPSSSDGVIEGVFESCPDTPSPDDGDEDPDDDEDKTDVQKFEFTKKAMHVKPNVIIGGGNIVDAKNVFISESVFKQNFQT